MSALPVRTAIPSGKDALDRQDALKVVHELVRFLEPVTIRVDVVGALRRGAKSVTEIELLCQPRIDDRPEPPQPDDLLYDEATAPRMKVNMQKELVDLVVDQGSLEKRPLGEHGKFSCGERVQYLLYRGFPVNIYCVIETALYGVAMIQRTGPLEFWQAMIMPADKEGAFLRRGEAFSSGALYRSGAIVNTPTEEDVFRELGLAFIHPEDRR